MQRRVHVGEVAEIHAQHQLADGLRPQLQHVLVRVPRLPAGVQLVEHGERVLDGPLHRGRVVPHGLRSQRGGQELVRQPPLLGVGVAQEDARLAGLDGVQRVTGDDLLGEVVVLGEEDLRQGRVVGLVDAAAHVVGHDERAVLFEQPLVVAQVVRVHLEVVAEVGEARGAGHVAHRLAGDGDGDGVFLGEHVGGGRQDAVVAYEADH